MISQERKLNHTRNTTHYRFYKPVAESSCVFIGGGHSRSGTTLMKRILCSHHEISTVAGGETRFWEYLTGLLPFVLNEEPFYSPKLSTIRHAAFREQIRGSFGDIPDIQNALNHFAISIAQSICKLQNRPISHLVEPRSSDDIYKATSRLLCTLLALSVVDPNAQLICEKTPNNAQLLDSVYKVMPKSKSIIMIRHPIDVALSHLERIWGPNEPLNAARYTKVYIQAWLETSSKVPDHFCLTVRYEDLVSDPINVMNTVFDFLGTQPTSESEAFAEKTVEPPVNRRSLLRSKTMNEIETILHEEIELLGYKNH